MTALLEFAKKHKKLSSFVGWVTRIFRLRGKRKVKLSAKRVMFKKCKIISTGKNNRLIIGEYSLISRCTFKFRGSNQTLIVGDTVALKDVTIMISGDRGKFTIGSLTSIHGPSKIHCAESSVMEIGNDCICAPGLDLTSGDGHSIISEDTKKRVNHAKHVKIGNHVWICSDVKILKGFEIGDNSVIAANAVCSSKHFGSNVIVAGQPAKVVKEGINWDRDLLP